jgi:hypothetical protein
MKIFENEENLMKECWKKFSKGDYLTDEEIELMIEQAKNALPYMESRGLNPAWSHTLTTIGRLREILFYRGKF